MVLLDGAPVPSCDTPLWQAADATVVTVEGLAADGPNPVQQSLIEHQAAQCGFCISGIVVRATALLEGHIGLASITERIEAIGGTISISTAQGKGTTVRAVLPVVVGAQPVA